MELPVLEIENIVLRKVKESDIDDRVKIGRHNEFVHMCGGDSINDAEYPDRSVWEKWYQKQLNEECAFIIDFNDKCIGTVRFNHISEKDRSATYSIGIFDPLLHSRGIGTKVTKLMLKYGFEELKLHRIDLKVLDYNKRGIKCYEKCGFRIDGVLRESAFIDGNYYSDIVMSILENEYRQTD